MKKEIGSEFWDIPLSKNANKYFPENTSWFISGRCALDCIIADIKSKYKVNSVSLPSWCCHSMIVPFLKSGIKVNFYPVVFENGKLVQDIDGFQKSDILLLMNYFGYNSDVNHSSTNSIIVRDITHSIFSNTYNDADYYFGSLRKWCGFKTGGFAVGTDSVKLPVDEKYLSLRKSAMTAKRDYLSGKSESKDFLKTFAEAEKYLEDCPVFGADPFEIGLASNIDVDFIRTQRRKNAGILLESLADMAIFPSLQKDDCPLFVPIIVPECDRDALQCFLAERKIYSPVHWPISEYHNLNERTEKIYKSELSIVCDHRYNEEDMHRVTNAIQEYFIKSNSTTRGE